MKSLSATPYRTVSQPKPRHWWEAALGIMAVREISTHSGSRLNQGAPAASCGRSRRAPRGHAGRRAAGSGGEGLACGMRSISALLAVVASLASASPGAALSFGPLDCSQAFAEASGCGPACLKAMCGRPLGRKQNLGTAERVIGCCHVSGLLCGRLCAAGPYGSARVGTTSLERARSAAHEPGSPGPALPTLRHTYSFDLLTLSDSLASAPPTR